MDSKQRILHWVEEIDCTKAERQKRAEITEETLTNSVHLGAKTPKHSQIRNNLKPLSHSVGSGNFSLFLS